MGRRVCLPLGVSSQVITGTEHTAPAPARELPPDIVPCRQGQGRWLQHRSCVAQGESGFPAAGRGAIFSSREGSLAGCLRAVLSCSAQHPFMAGCLGSC